MSIDKCDWQDHKDIDRWVAEWKEEAGRGSLDFSGKRDPLDELRNRVARGDFAGKNKASVESYLDSADTRVRRISDDGRADREERAVAAAETSAAAAVRSADSARRAAKWAGWAVALALVGLVVSALQHIKDWLD